MATLANPYDPTNDLSMVNIANTYYPGGGNIYLGYGNAANTYTGAVGTLNMHGGTMNVYQFVGSYTGTGITNQDGGTINYLQAMNICWVTSGIYNMTGGESPTTVRSTPISRVRTATTRISASRTSTTWRGGSATDNYGSPVGKMTMGGTGAASPG